MLRQSIVFVALTVIATEAAAHTPSAEVPRDPSRYIAKARRAGPDAVVEKASYAMRQPDGSLKDIQKGSNGFTCLVLPDGAPACADAGGLAWIAAVLSRGPAPEEVGIVYMMAGDAGMSTHDPFARESRKHWVQTGPHVMIVGKAAQEVTKRYPRSLDPDPSQPFVMYPGTPYEHLKLPVQEKAHTH
jgi:hypothetical protein